MEAMYRGSSCLAIAFAVTLLGSVTPSRADADSGVAVFPGMELHQGSTVCTLGLVETTLRIALATGQCDGGSVATDSHGHVVGAVVTARHSAADAAAVDGSTTDAEYEVIRLADTVQATNVLPTGRQLQSTPGVSVQPAESVCHFGISTGQTCGRVGPVGNGRFVVTGVAADEGDVGGPVYTLTDDNRAVIVGLFEGVSGSGPTAESWQAAMRQLYLDGRSLGQGPPPGTVRIASAHPNVS
jgi:hypothetical protein